MSLKKFIVSAVSIVLAFTLAFLTNIFVRGSVDQKGATRIALSYFATTTFPDGQSATDNVWVDMIKEDIWGNKTMLVRIGPNEVFGETFACGSDTNYS